MDLLVTPIICLAMNIFFEARSEPILGQAAVAQVVLNRVASEDFPNTVCAVVKDAKLWKNTITPIRHKCQFSWYCDGKPDRPDEKEAGAWATAVELAIAVYDGKIVPLVGESLYYHADWIKEKRNHVNPIIIGKHIFY